jgi:predicted  nucleic acid-binding Zn-ribbon protein
LRSQAGSELNESLQAAKAHVEAQNKELEAARLQIEQLKNEQSLQKTSFENEILRLNQQLKNEQSEADAKLKASNDES